MFDAAAVIALTGIPAVEGDAGVRARSGKTAAGAFAPSNAPRRGRWWTVPRLAAAVWLGLILLPSNPARMADGSDQAGGGEAYGAGGAESSRFSDGAE